MSDSIRSYNYRFIVYPDSAPHDWLKQLDDLQVQTWISPCHNADPEDGDLKPHYHVVIHYDTQHTLDGVQRQIGHLAANGHIKKADSLGGSVRYLIHANHPRKQQWLDAAGLPDQTQITCLAGAEVGCFFDHADEKIYAEIANYIMDFHVGDIADLVDYARYSHPEWLGPLTSKSYYFLNLLNAVNARKMSREEARRRCQLESVLREEDFDGDLNILISFMREYKKKKGIDISA